MVSDDGTAIYLTAYGQDGTALPVQLSPVRAIAIADELIGAALPKIGKEAQPMTPQTATRACRDA